MNTDSWRLHYTYLLALVVLAGAFGLLLIPTPDITGGEKLAFVGATVGGVIAFVFNRESAVAASRAAERAMQQGAAQTAAATHAADNPNAPLVRTPDDPPVAPEGD